MKRSCQSCGIEKDDEVLEYYKYDDSIAIDSPVSPLFELSCQPNDFNSPFRIATVCHECFHKLDPDMWISEACWKKLNPVVEFSKLELENRKQVAI